MAAPTHLEYLIDSLVERFRARKPIRTGDLIITVFGDIVVTRGGTLWLGSLLKLMRGFGMSDGLVRTSMTRLVGEGWLQRHHVGRQSYYGFSASGRARSVAAARRIYAGAAAPWPGSWRVVLLPGGAPEARDSLRKALAGFGFASVGPGALIAPSRPNEELDRDLQRLLEDHEAVVIDGAGPAGGGGLRRLARDTWDLAALRAAYDEFLGHYQPIRDALGGGESLDRLRAVQTRLLLVHAYRRVLLRDPGLPSEMLPADWSGGQALDVCRDIYARLAAPSESWISETFETESGPLPLPGSAFFARFGGIAETTPEKAEA